MGSHDQQLRNPRYRDWVKAGLALKYLKDGIEDFVNDETKEQQKNILAEVQKEIGRPGATCNSCPIDQLRAYKQGRYKKSNRWPNDVCDRIFDKIAEQHIYGRPSWSNTDSTKWCTDYWEIAKCFIDGGGYGDKITAADTDCKGLLSIITNSMFVQRHVDTPIDRFEPKSDVFSKCKEARNKILHLASLQLPVETLNNYIDVMIQLLGDKGRLHEYENAKQAISKLRQLKETDLYISTENEWEIREAALKAVQERKQDALNEIEKKQNEVLGKLKIDKIQETIDELSKTTKETSQSFSNRHESLEKRQILLESTFKKHQTEMSKTVVELQQDVADLKKCLSDLKARFDAFDEVELQHKKRITYLDHKKGIRQELFNMYSKYLSNIPMPSLLQKLDATVDEFYMELEICDDLVYEKRSDENRYYGKPVRNFHEIFYKEGNYDENIVKNYHDIFYKEGKRVEHIYVLGDAGVGKTTWCYKLIHTWLQGLTKQETEATHSLSPNEKMMQEFDFVLFLSLRHASKDANITDMIRNQIFHQTPQLLEHMQEVLDTEPDRCLVIADGLDEWNAPDNQKTFTLGNDSSFPSRKNMNHCTVLTTTRPWKLNAIQPSKSLIDRAVMIRGFGGDDCVRNLAEKVIHKLNQNVSHETSQEKNEKKVENFQQELYKRFPCYMFGDSVTQIPLILILMVVKWFNDGSLECTMAGNYSFMLKSMFEHEEGYRNIKPKFKRNQKFDGRLSRVSYIEEAKQEWSTDAEKLPECVRKHSVCCQYSRLILKLSEIAFEGLFDRNDKALIFSEDRLYEKLSPEEVEVAVLSGILSKSDVVGTCNVSKLSFLHKTVQEFMAAIHMGAYHANYNNISFQRFEEYCSDTRSIYEMEKFILFSSGLDPNVAIKILKHVNKVEYKYFLEIYEPLQSQYLGSSLRLVVKCVKELREVSVKSMPMVHLISIVTDDMTSFDELLDLLETIFDKGSIKLVDVEMLDEQGPGPNRLLDILSSEMCPLISLTTLTLEHISRNALSTRTNKEVKFTLHNLRKLELCHINISSIDQKGTGIVFDFSHSKNIKYVHLNSLSSCKINFIGNNIEKLKIEQLKCCYIKIDNDTALHVAEKEETMFDQLCILDNHYRSFQSFCGCITLLTCKENLFCCVDINPNICIDSVKLTDTAAPNINWKGVKTLVLKGNMNSLSTQFYADVLDGISRSQNLASLQCIGCDQYVIAEILKAVNSLINLIHLEVSGNETNPADKIFFFVNTIKLNGSGLRILVKESKSKVISKFSPITTIKLSKVSPLLKNDKVLVQSLVYLECLKCKGFTEGDFIMLGECFQYLRNLKDLELSSFKWDKVENHSVFSCLEEIENLKQMKLVNFSPVVMSEISLCLPNLMLSELLLGDNFQGMIQCLNNMKMLEKLSLKISCKEELLKCTGLIKNIKRIQYLTVHLPVKRNVFLYVPGKEQIREMIDLSEFAHLKYFSVENLQIYSNKWQTFVSCLPKNGQLETLEFAQATVRDEATKQLIKSMPGFVCKKWEYVPKKWEYDPIRECNIILKAK